MLVLGMAMDTMMQVTNIVLINEMFLSLPSTDHYHQTSTSLHMQQCNTGLNIYFNSYKTKVVFGLLQLHHQFP